MHHSNLELHEIRQLAKEAWIYGLPLVEHFKMFSLYRSNFSPVYRDWNHFFHVRNLMTPDARAVVSPNTDTLMSSILIDLRDEPVVIEIPNLKDRYFSLQLIDIFTNSFAYAGTRATGNDASTMILLGPDCEATIPEELAHATIIHSPSRLVLGLGRTAAKGREDTRLARELQNQLNITPLCTYLNANETKIPEPINWPMYFDVKHQDGLEFFQYVNFMLQWHKLSDADSVLLQRLKKIGIQPGADFNLESLPNHLQDAVKQGAADGRAHIEALAAAPGELVNGWIHPHENLGNFANNFELRAVTAWSFLYANALDEATYIRAYVDQEIQSLDAAQHRYELHFDVDQIPKGQFFWSLTMYDGEEYFLYENSIKRYSIGDRTERLQYNEDGSLSLFLQHEPPADEQAPNWLPAPKGPFYVALRIYGHDRSSVELPGIIRRPLD